MTSTTITKASALTSQSPNQSFQRRSCQQPASNRRRRASLTLFTRTSGDGLGLGGLLNSSRTNVRPGLTSSFNLFSQLTILFFLKPMIPVWSGAGSATGSLILQTTVALPCRQTQRSRPLSIRAQTTAGSTLTILGKNPPLIRTHLSNTPVAADGCALLSL